MNNKLPELKNEIVILRQLTEHDAGALLESMNESAEEYDAGFSSRQNNLIGVKEKIQAYQNAIDSDSDFIYGIFSADDGNLLGRIAVRQLWDMNGPKVTSGPGRRSQEKASSNRFEIFVRKSKMRCGYASEACKLLLDHLHKSGFKFVTFIVRRENDLSLNFLQKHKINCVPGKPADIDLAALFGDSEP